MELPTGHHPNKHSLETADDYHFDSQVDALVEGSGYDLHDAMQMVSDRLGITSETNADAVEPNQTDEADTLTTQRLKRPTGKVLEGPSGIEESRRIASADALATPVDPEQRQASGRRGIALAKEALYRSVVEDIRDAGKAGEVRDPYDPAKQAEQTELIIAARLRTHHDKRPNH
ncbi:MAG TPA: hypothetical protein VF597_02345 [Candidatus Saccharimonadales bacterium]|jgi:hypothetical protein